MSSSLKEPKTKTTCCLSVYAILKLALVCTIVIVMLGQPMTIDHFLCLLLVATFATFWQVTSIWCISWFWSSSLSLEKSSRYVAENNMSLLLFLFLAEHIVLKRVFLLIGQKTEIRSNFSSTKNGRIVLCLHLFHDVALGLILWMAMLNLGWNRMCWVAIVQLGVCSEATFCLKVCPLPRCFISRKCFLNLLF